jgi:8-oxo-dGTP diphosphatase
VAGIARKGNLFFIARRGAGGALGGKWEFPGGKVEDGEDARAALIREFNEEFGLAVTVGSFLGSAVFAHRGVERPLYAHEVRFQGEPALREHTAWKWASLAEIETLDFAGSDRLLLPALSASPGIDAAAE